MCVGVGECAYPVYLQVFLKSPSWKMVLFMSDGEISISSCVLVAEIAVCVYVCVV